ncbi:hypothetical protein F4806DRAFT_49119 [Annulohypoxylon nitens]|nr:hypothetical protein F4806DRAFT_49119 [Annulohypoxylon nitens]
MAMTTNSESPLTSFTRFPDLPTELRLKIWDETLEPRVVEVHLEEFIDLFPDSNGRSHPFRWSSTSRNPVALFVCFESRKQACSRFPVVLSVFRLGAGKRPIPRHIRFDPASDMLAFVGYLEFPLMLELVRKIRVENPAGRGLERIGVAIDFLRSKFTHWGSFVQHINEPGHLKEVVLLTYPERLRPVKYGYVKCALEEAPGMMPHARAFEEHLQQLPDPIKLRIMHIHFIRSHVVKSSVRSRNIATELGSAHE